jgi:hypothetical protein
VRIKALGLPKTSTEALALLERAEIITPAQASPAKNGGILQY